MELTAQRAKEIMSKICYSSVTTGYSPMHFVKEFQDNPDITTREREFLENLESSTIEIKYLKSIVDNYNDDELSLFVKTGEVPYFIVYDKDTAFPSQEQLSNEIKHGISCRWNYCKEELSDTLYVE